MLAIIFSPIGLFVPRIFLDIWFPNLLTLSTPEPLKVITETRHAH